MTAPAVPALIAQQSPATNNRPAPTSPAPPPLDATTPPAPFNRTPPAAAESPKLVTAVADEVADMTPKFFNGQQFEALRKLSEIIMPPMKGAPGALDARAPEFLDFLISESPNDRQQLYRAGLDALNNQAKKRFNKPYADLEQSQAVTLLAPLREPWTYDPPADPLARFLRAAKQDIRSATMNSREYSTALALAGGRRGSGIGLYWYPLD